MLIRFVVSNFLSFGKECEFNMLTAPLKTHPDHVYYNPTKRLKVLKGAAIYGANGAGKSNLVKAINMLRSAVVSGHIRPDMSRFKYKLDDEISERPIVFDVEYEWNKKFYAYHLEMQDDLVLEESLYELGFRQEDKILFERKYNAQTKKINVVLRTGRGTDSKTKLLASILADNILDGTKLLLSSHNMLGSRKVTNAFQWFDVGLQIIFPSTVYHNIVRPLSLSGRFSAFANSVMTSLDTGVVKVGVEEIPFDDFFTDADAQYKKELVAQLRERKADIPVLLKNGITLAASINDSGNYVIKKPVTYHESSSRSNVVFDIEEESDGTQRLLDIIPAIDMYLNFNVTVIVDEVDESLHPSLLKAIMHKIMNSGPAYGGQFIITTHESNLLDYDIYRQDEIWFVEKNNGSTELYPLTDFKPRADLQLQKGYLMGRFGAVPFLANLKDLNWQ